MFPGKRSWLAEGYWHMLLEAIWDGVSRDGPVSVLFSWRDYTIELEKPIRRGFFFFLRCDGPNLQLQRFLNSVRKPIFLFFFLAWQLSFQRVKLKEADLSVIGSSEILRKKKKLMHNYVQVNWKKVQDKGLGAPCREKPLGEVRARTCGTKSPRRSEALRFIDSSKSPSKTVK